MVLDMRFLIVLKVFLASSFSIHLLKDRQQEARAVLVGSRYIGDCYMVLELRYMYYIPLTTLLSGLFIDIKYVKFTGPETKRA